MKRHNYFKEGFLILIGILIFSAAGVYGEEESITLTTYYPSPYGVYNEMRMYPHSPATIDCVPANENQAKGTLYYDATQDQLKVCGGDPLDWQDITGYWRLAGSNLFPRNNSWNVGIGTNNPEERLDVAGMAHFSDVIKSGSLSVANNIMGVVGMTDVGGLAVGFANGSGAVIGKNATLSGPGVALLGPGGVPEIGMGGDTVMGYLEAYLGKDLMFRTQTANSVIYMKDSTGRVGIGTTNPQYPLDLVSTSDSLNALVVRNLANTYLSGIGVGPSDKQSGIAAQIPGKTWFLLADGNQGNAYSIVEQVGAGYHSRLAVKPGGNVGIGTTNPNNSKGAPGYLDAADVYLRDAGRWASEVSTPVISGDKVYTRPKSGANGVVSYLMSSTDDICFITGVFFDDPGSGDVNGAGCTIRKTGSEWYMDTYEEGNDVICTARCINF